MGYYHILVSLSTLFANEPKYRNKNQEHLNEMSLIHKTEITSALPLRQLLQA